MDTNISKIIRLHRKKSGLTQIELAELAGVGKNMVHGIEKGHLSVQFNNLLKILAALNIHIEYSSPLIKLIQVDEKDK